MTCSWVSGANLRYHSQTKLSRRAPGNAKFLCQVGTPDYVAPEASFPPFCISDLFGISNSQSMSKQCRS